MKGIYVEIGDTLQTVEKNSDGLVTPVRVQCVEGVGCKDCYFRPGNCEFLLCSIGDRFDRKAVIFTRIYGEGGVK